VSGRVAVLPSPEVAARTPSARQRPASSREPRPASGRLQAIGKRAKDGLLILEVAGRAERGVADRVALAEARRRLLAQSPAGFVVDARHLVSMPVTTFSALVADQPRLVEAGGGVVFAGLSPELVDQLWRKGWVANQHPWLPAYASVSEAAAALAARRVDASSIDPARLTVRFEDGRVALRGALDQETAALCASRLRQLLRGGQRLVLDLEGLADAEHEAVDGLLGFVHEARRRGQEIALHGAWGAVAEVLRAFQRDLEE
jgi:anti-anti-sigma regulatory factor